MRILVLAVSIIAGAICGLIGTLISERMVTDVNARLPVQEQFSRTGWHHYKSQRLWKTYCELYPTGPLIARMRALSIVAVAAVPGLFWGIGFGPVTAGGMFAAMAVTSWYQLWR